MTRSEFVNSLDTETKSKFIANLTNMNAKGFAKSWLQTKKPLTPGILGAFSIPESPEGTVYWLQVNEKAMEVITQGGLWDL